MKRLLLKFKYTIRYSMPEPAWQFLASIIRILRNRQYQEKFKSYGDLNPNLTFYVIRRRPPAWGFFSNYFFVVRGLIYAEKYNFIPVVDMENYWVSELSSIKKINNTFNAWCYFYNQTSNFTLSEVYKSKKVVLSDGHSILKKDHFLHDKSFQFITNVSALQTLNKIIKKYINLNEPTMQELEKYKLEVNWDPSQTLGIFVRGTNYTIHKNTSENLDLLISKCNQIMLKHNLTKVYISTEDFSIYEYLSSQFSNFEVIPAIRNRNFKNLNEWIASQDLTFDGGILMGYSKTLNYLIEALILAECHNFVCTPSNFSLYVLSLADLKVGNKYVLRNKNFMKIN